jgi:hypothetical protein
MAKGNRRSAVQCGEMDDQFPLRVAAWIARDGRLLEALTTCRRLGEEGEQAVEALGEIRRVVNLRLSWELWESLSSGSGQDPERLLAAELGIAAVDRARYAIWGPTWRMDGRPQLTVIET